MISGVHELTGQDLVPNGRREFNGRIYFTSPSSQAESVSCASRLYKPLGHYTGAPDANTAWPGIISFLKILRAPFQEEFLCAPDVPWPAAEAAVCVVGAGAGNTTYLLVAQEGHSRVEGGAHTAILEVDLT
ncbi:hypothetical protein DFH09DRAFT_1080033 [Mycena vulgaris]|nr:hypothetical protein DFH09DRAFT_1080033 [Mycena vulgaris]